ncbi:NADPH-dependent FMN reductase [cf. Phormidesmis sp. LEGE 11477]|uniref:NADPH-dependent FMN reductase n=1 Tax=cf. Phormidesmis sp. LEGE 11477 TaxID=1828680 RepID=UPI00187F8469|nr:NADPH-dependent FMN reductase [cf. Phormidesmis sp. LEGE 11477]MBE9061394.1 NADPH-dependent FMN reductase [cf. Phormidesmis sp. LEGE 11477]
MHDILAIAGSPSVSSRSSAVLAHSTGLLEAQGLQVETFTIRDIKPEDLVFANFESPELQKFTTLVAEAKGIMIATPVYKATYTGILKALLDLLPQYAFLDKILFPIATGGTITHLLSLEYAMKPLFAVLGATHIERGLFIVDSQMQRLDEGGIQLDGDIETRLQDSLLGFASAIKAKKP